MDDPKAAVASLIERGKQFTYDNFATKSSSGYVSALSTEWIAWTTRVSGAVEKLFGNAGPAYRIILNTYQIPLVGNDRPSFERSISGYLAALEVSAAALEKDTFGELLRSETAIAGQDITNKVFVVHGHDDAAKAELEIILREMGLEPIVLHRQADGGRTIIEKFEDHADVGFAFILLTPDEFAYLAADQQKPDNERTKELRARPNVIWEFGYFVGKIGRKRTCCLYKGEVTLPSDLSGLIYKKFSRSIEEVAYSIRKELTAAGYKLSN